MAPRPGPPVLSPVASAWPSGLHRISPHFLPSFLPEAVERYEKCPHILPNLCFFKSNVPLSPSISHPCLQSSALCHSCSFTEWVGYVFLLLHTPRGKHSH